MTRLAWQALGRDQRGANIVEFGFVALPLILVLLVIIDFGYRMYLETVVEGTIARAARRVTVGGLTSDQVDAYVRSQLVAFSRNATITINKKSYYQFSNVGKPEKIVYDANNNGRVDAGDCFEDSLTNGQYDSNAGKTGLGGADDIVYYEVIVTFPRLVPLGRFLGFSNTESVSANTILRNQPYAAQAKPPRVCL